MAAPPPSGPDLRRGLPGVDQILQEPTVRDVLVSGGSEIAASKPAEFRKIIESDYAKYGKLADLFRSAK